jgi:hypothetical protein
VGEATLLKEEHMSEKVIVIGVDEGGSSFAKCLNFHNDRQLEKDVYSRFNCNDFIVFYEENLVDLEEALEDAFSENTSVKLSTDDRRCMRDMMQSGEFTQKEVAAHYGVCRQTVWRICKKG